jgi:superfamily II DNA or RNA helicase
MQLRQDQIKFVNEINAAFRAGHKSVMGVASTAFGKTVVSARMIMDYVDNGTGLVGFLVDTNTLIDQTIERLRQCGYEGEIGILSGDHPRPTWCERVYVISLQTLERNKQYLSMPWGFFIFDECHTTLFRKISKDILSAKSLFLSLTATPLRAKTSQKFKDYVSYVVLSPTHRELQNAGSLSPLEYYVIASPDMAGVKVVGFEYEEEETARLFSSDVALKTSLDALKDLYEIKGPLPTLIFERNVANTHLIAEYLTDNFIYTAPVTGSTPRRERMDIYERFRAGEIQAISSCMALSKGFDMPCAVVGLDRAPCYSRSSYVQKVGRLARISEGKSNGIIIDAAGNRTRHPCPSSIEYDADTVLNGLPDRPTAELPKICPACGKLSDAPHLMQDLMIICRNCGTEIEEVKVRAPKVKQEIVGKDLEGKLVLLSDGYMNKIEQVELHRNLLRSAYRQGKKLGWAYHQFRLRTGLSSPPKGKAKGAVLGDNPSYEDMKNFVDYLRGHGESRDQIDWAVRKETGGTTWTQIQIERSLTATK